MQLVPGAADDRAYILKKGNRLDRKDADSISREGKAPLTLLLAPRLR